jgi:hypothetical protein
MSNPLQIGIRVVLSFIVVCHICLASPPAAPPPSKVNQQAIAFIKGPLDATVGVKVNTGMQEQAPLSLIVVVGSISSFTKPTCYSEPYTETTELLQFCISLTKTASLTTSS